MLDRTRLNTLTQAAADLKAKIIPADVQDLISAHHQLDAVEAEVRIMSHINPDEDRQRLSDQLEERIAGLTKDLDDIRKSTEPHPIDTGKGRG